MSQIKTRANEELLKGLKRKATKKAVLLYSSGIDSTAAGIILKSKGFEIFPLFIDYGQSSLEAEKYLVETSAPKIGFKECKVIKTDIMKQLSKSMLLGNVSINDKDAWVPGRNTLFMVIAGIYAKQIDADGIAIGYMLDDNFVFGDNDYFHHKNMEELLSKSFLQPMRVFLPTKSMEKKHLIQMLQDSDLLSMTTSCWNAKLSNGDVIPCRKCANCKEREGFIKSIQRRKL